MALIDDALTVVPLWAWLVMIILLSLLFVWVVEMCWQALKNSGYNRPRTPGDKLGYTRRDMAHVQITHV
jgi:hypothetical protein